jgi:hypothetical protein
MKMYSHVRTMRRMDKRKRIHQFRCLMMDALTLIHPTIKRIFTATALPITFAHIWALKLPGRIESFQPSV